jgi:hypothetical protein
MRDDELQGMLAELAPIRDREVDELELGAAERELMREIVAVPPAGAAARRRVGAIRRFRPLRVGVALSATAAAVGAVLFIGVGSGGSPSRPEFAAAAIRVAEANPRLLVTLPGWKVTSADEFEADSGEMTFGDGQHELQVTWYPARYYGSYQRDREDVSTPEEITLLGQTATMVDYGGGDFATMLPPDGATFVEIRGALDNREGYLDVVNSLRPTDVETWLSALPPGVVQPDDRAAVVDEMLRGVPLPPNFDVEKLRSESAVLSRYQLGAKVTGAVACDWLDRWVAATAAGDAAAADAAVQALSTSRDWSILREMADQGGWSQAVWQYSRQIAAGKLDQRVGATEVREDGTTFEYGPAYALGLGCDSQYRRRVDGGG